MDIEMEEDMKEIYACPPFIVFYYYDTLAGYPKVRKDILAGHTKY